MYNKDTIGTLPVLQHRPRQPLIKLIHTLHMNQIVKQTDTFSPPVDQLLFKAIFDIPFQRHMWLNTNHLPPLVRLQLVNGYTSAVFGFRI